MQEVLHGNRQGRDKKLIAAARHWASSGGATPEDAENFAGALEAFGAPAEMVVEQRKASEEEQDSFPVHEDNWITVQAFMALQTQWQRSLVSDGERQWWVYVGINYGGFPTALKMVGATQKQTREIYLGLQLMEYAALPVLNARDETDD